MTIRPSKYRWWLPTLLVALIGCASLSGCTGLGGGRMPPPGGGLEALLDGGTGGAPPAGEQGLQIDIPRENAAGISGAVGNATANGIAPVGFVAPTSPAEAPPVPAFTIPQISSAPPTSAAPPAFIPPATATPLPTPSLPPSGRIKAPDGGFKSIDGKTSQHRSLRGLVAALPPPPDCGPHTIRGQNPAIPPNPYPEQPAYPYGQPGYAPVQPVQYQQPVYPAPGASNNGFGQPVQPYGQPQYASQPGVNSLPAPPAGQPQVLPQVPGQPSGQPTQPFMQPPSGNGVMPYVFPWFNPPSATDPNAMTVQSRPTPLDIVVEETRTGRFMFGVGVNSDAGVTGQITIDERNFDLFNPPTSFDDFANGTAWRGRGQGFRIEAQPGTQVQRYVVSFTEPYLMNLPVSMTTSGFYYTRGFTDWAEDRVGGRLGFGYRLTPDLSLAGSLRAENVNIYSPRVIGVPALDRVVGNNDIYSARVSLSHDTRDIPFAPTEGHYIDLAAEQAFGEFDFTRFDAEYSQYWMLKERPDGSGRHTVALSLKGGITGADTPIFENYFAGGFSTLRGFAFRGASPVESTVTVGGRLKLLGALEYFFPLTADDMVKGVVFCDVGTVERDVKIVADNFRVAPGFGFRINVPALGPAPLAFDFAFPIAYADTDSRQVFSFFVGLARQ